MRGVANDDLSAFFAFRLGRSLAVEVRAAATGSVLIGRDTRRSGDLLFSALSAGLMSAGLDVVDLGVLPTAGVALLGRRAGALSGMISASHNPARDNGIKFFGRDGRKIADEVETAVEERLPHWHEGDYPTAGGVGTQLSGGRMVDDYRTFLLNTGTPRLDGLRVVMDCGNGAAWQIGPEVAAALGAEVIPLACSPDGLNINLRCGALHPEVVQQAVLDHNADMGVAFDGDADRAIFADEKGGLVDGDRVMALCGIAWAGTDRLPGNQVVGTVMSNLGLEHGLAARGIRLHRSPVGDRQVASLMEETGSALGGEKSGHLIFSQLATTGDGVLTFLQVAGVMRATGRPLSELAGQIEEYPQVLVNVPVWRRRGWREQPDLWQAVKRGEQRLGREGRVLVRASGTERLLRVMAEGSEESLVREIVDDIASVIRQKFGEPQTGEAAVAGAGP